jgi:hypothetical protein
MGKGSREKRRRLEAMGRAASARVPVVPARPALGSHDRWKSHGHSLSRDVLWNELRLRIDHPDATLERVMVRIWAVLTYIFDKTPIVKMLCSAHYRYARHIQVQIIGPVQGPHS